MPWHNENGSIRPVNAISGKAYRGVNSVSLWASAQDQGYDCPQWATYRQWDEIGAQVRKGEKASLVVFWKIRDNDTEAESEGQDDDKASSRLIIAKGYSVFNAAQVDGYVVPCTTPKPAVERIEHADKFFAATGMQVRHGGNRAFYRPATDQIQMPPVEAFYDPLSYYGTLAHEATHWTGVKDRLDRNMKERFKLEEYAAEELVAELGAAFLCTDLGLTSEPRPENAAYIASWLKVLKDDARAIFTAAAKAQQAADYIHSLQPTPEAEPESVQTNVVFSRTTIPPRFNTFRS